VGDVIVKFDGTDITEVLTYRTSSPRRSAKEVQVTIIRNGAEYTKTVKIGVCFRQRLKKNASVILPW